MDHAAESNQYRRYQLWAEERARETGALLMRHFRHVEAREKGPGDLVTDADHASQRLFAERLAREFPDHTLLAEEEGAVPDPSRPFRWIVDPLDGTINFAHGMPLWCVSIALEHAGQIVAGVIHAPCTRELFSASAGGGATLNGEPIQVSRRTALRESLISAGMPTGFAADAGRQLALMGRFSTNTHSLRRTGSTAWNLGQLAAGACEVFYATSVHPWDVAAGVLLVREAGGTVTGLQGEPYDLYSPHILATNGGVHAEAVNAVAEALGLSLGRGG